MKVYGYCRISTEHQSIERQIRNIKEVYPNVIIIEEVFSGTSTERPKWNKLKQEVKKGTTIIFDSVSRMSRNSSEGLAEYFELYEKGVELIFLKEPHINTATYESAIEQAKLTETDNKVLQPILNGVTEALKVLAKQQIQLAFEQAEKEVQDLRQRTREGMLTAKIEGKQIGRIEGSKIETKKAKIMKARMKKMSRAFGGQMSDKEVMETLGIARGTYYKYKKELTET